MMTGTPPSVTSVTSSNSENIQLSIFESRSAVNSRSAEHWAVYLSPDASNSSRTSRELSRKPGSVWVRPSIPAHGLKVVRSGDRPAAAKVVGGQMNSVEKSSPPEITASNA